MKEGDVNQRIAMRVRELRAAQGASLDAVAAKSGVSRSTISLIERGETSATAVVLEKLAGSLGVPLGALFAPAGGAAPSPSGPLARRADQPEWRDPASGYLRRAVSPQGFPCPLRIVEVHFPAAARVVFENARRNANEHQQIWVLDGAVDVQVGPDAYRLKAGDCLAMQLDHPIMFHNPTRKPARYAVVVTP